MMRLTTPVDTGTGAIDENDQPNEEYDPKTINRLIRQLLNLYEESYIGYTATPFANVFIIQMNILKKVQDYQKYMTC